MTTFLAIAIGTRGDVDPFVRLGRSLQARGHRFRIAAFGDWAHIISDAGLEVVDLGPMAYKSDAMRQWRTWRAGKGRIATARHLAQYANVTAMSEVIRRVVAACDDTDAILCPSATVGFDVGEALGIPVAFVHLQPWEPTAAFPPWMISTRSRGPRGNRALYTVFERAAALAVRSRANTWRADVLGLPPLPWSGHGRLIRRRGMAVICAFSATVVPRPDDWDARVAITGFWHDETAPAWSPPADLREFLDAGDPPVFVGFGSWFPEEGGLDELVCAALRSAGVRGLLQFPGRPGGYGDDMFVVGDVPHDALFPLVAAVVHHGGAGTTASALRAGVPSIVCPFVLDQFFWASRVAALGAGPEPVRLEHLSVATLAAAIRTAVSDREMRSAAEQAGMALRTENGTERAADAVEKCFATTNPRLERAVGREDGRRSS